MGSGDETDPNEPRTELKPTARALFLVLSFYMNIDNTVNWEIFMLKIIRVKKFCVDKFSQFV